jgi:hypothetical protein
MGLHAGEVPARRLGKGNTHAWNSMNTNIRDKQTQIQDTTNTYMYIYIYTYTCTLNPIQSIPFQPYLRASPPYTFPLTVPPVQNQRPTGTIFFKDGWGVPPPQV